jgi:hypothetical protein
MYDTLGHANSLPVIGLDFGCTGEAGLTFEPHCYRGSTHFGLLDWVLPNELHGSCPAICKSSLNEFLLRAPIRGANHDYRLVYYSSTLEFYSVA